MLLHGFIINGKDCYVRGSFFCGDGTRVKRVPTENVVCNVVSWCGSVNVTTSGCLSAWCDLSEKSIGFGRWAVGMLCAVRSSSSVMLFFNIQYCACLSADVRRSFSEGGWSNVKCMSNAYLCFIISSFYDINNIVIE